MADQSVKGVLTDVLSIPCPKCEAKQGEPCDKDQPAKTCIQRMTRYLFG